MTLALDAFDKPLELNDTVFFRTRAKIEYTAKVIGLKRGKLIVEGYDDFEGRVRTWNINPASAYKQ